MKRSMINCFLIKEYICGVPFCKYRNAKSLFLRLPLFCSLICIGLTACREEVLGPTEKGVKPARINQYTVENLPGAAIIKYAIPDSNTAYILAEYSPKEGVKSEAKASKYKDSLLVNGFSRAGKYEVTLYAVGIDEQRSDPITIEVDPLIPPYIATFNTLAVRSGFAGIAVTALNATQSDLVIETIIKDPTLDKWTVGFRHSSNAADIRYIATGFEAGKHLFGFYVRDRWSNFSDTLFAELETISEKKINMSGFYQTNFPGDVYQVQADTWNLNTLFNGTASSPVLLTVANSGMPQHFTVFLQNTFQLSRIKVWPRQTDAYFYGSATPRKFKIWGCMEPDPSGSMDGWTELGQFENIKPSGLPGSQLNDADRQQGAAGDTYIFELGTIPVRYIRFQTLETWGLLSHVCIAELELYGAQVN